MMPSRTLWYAAYREKQRLVQAMRKAEGEKSYLYMSQGHHSTREQKGHDPRLKTATGRKKSIRARGRDTSQRIQAEVTDATKEWRAMIPVQDCRPDMFVGMRFELLEYRSCFGYLVGLH